MRLNSLRLRLILGAALWCVAGFAVGGYALSTLFSDYVERSFDRRLLALLDSVIAGTEALQGGGASVVRPPQDSRFDSPYSGWYWQIDGADGPMERSRSLWDSTLPPVATTGALRYRNADGPVLQPVRIAAKSVALPGADGRILVQLAGDRTESIAEIDRFNRLLMWALGLMGAGLVLGVVLQVQIGLRPLNAIGRSLQRIRAGDADRLDGDFPSEVAPLAGEINSLLDHNRSVLERTRTQAGNLAHALKTPLTILANATAGDDSDLRELVARQTGEMRRQVDHHLARARAAATAGTLAARAPVAPVIDGLVRVMQRIHRDRTLTISSNCAQALAFAGDRQDLEEVLGNVLDNACKWAAGQVVLRAEQVDDVLVITVDDDGPGLPAGRRDAVMKRGARLDESKPGTGLGLSIVADLVELYDGAVDLEAAPTGGLRVSLRLPAAPAG